MYADILFLVNFSMDYLSLYIAGRFFNRRMTFHRILISSAVGGVYGVAAAASAVSGAIQIILGIIVSLVMCLIAFSSIKICAVFWCVSAVLGGVMTALYSFLSSNIGDLSSAERGSIIKTEGAVGLNHLIGLAVISGIIVVSLVKLISSSPAANGKSVGITIFLNKKSSSFEALPDSGNLLSDPVSGRPVIVVSAEVLKNIFDQNTYEILKNREVSKFPETNPQIRNKLRLIPKNTLNEKTVLAGFVPDSIIITNGKHTKERDAVIAVADTSKNHFGGFAATVPISLLR